MAKNFVERIMYGLYDVLVRGCFNRYIYIHIILTIAPEQAVLNETGGLFRVRTVGYTCHCQHRLT